MVQEVTSLFPWRLLAIPARIIVAWDLSSTRPAARMPMPSVRIFSAIETLDVGVRNLAIGVPVRSLKRLPQDLQR